MLTQHVRVKQLVLQESRCQCLAQLKGNHMHVLGESISFGRFTSESLSWEKWSSFSHKKYVEEAERYAKPGSVAQKKAFFEAHYKRIAAQKAAALLEQQIAEAEAERINGYNNGDDHEEESVLLNSHSDVRVEMEGVKIQDEKEDDLVKIQDEKEDDLVKIQDEKEDDLVNIDSIVVVETGGVEDGENGVISVKRNSDDLLNQDTVSASESSEIPQIERPLLKQNSVDSDEVTSKKRSGLSSLRTSIQQKTWRVPSTPAKQVTPHFNKENSVFLQSTRKSNAESLNEKRSSPKSLRALLSLAHNNESDKEPVFPTKKSESSGLARGRGAFKAAPKDCSTPFKTPSQASSKSASTCPAATPRTENRRMKTPVDDPSASGRKTTGPKWHMLSAVYTKSLSAYRNKLQSPTVSTPFTLRTEERAAKRKQKLEEKFNASEVEKKMQLQKTFKEKAGNEFRKLSCSLCFKARPLPDFYKEKETPKIQMKNSAAAEAESRVLGRSISNKKQGGTVSMPPPPPPPTCLTKNKVPKNLSSKNVLNHQSKLVARSLPERTTHENASPNIQQ